MNTQKDLKHRCTNKRCTEREQARLFIQAGCCGGVSHRPLHLSGDLEDRKSRAVEAKKASGVPHREWASGNWEWAGRPWADA